MNETISWDDYARAERFMPWRVEALVRNLEVSPLWLADRDRFWYRRQEEGRDRLIVVDPDMGTRRDAFDHDRLRAALP